MKILIEPSSHHLLNYGDAAMLQTAFERVRRYWPAARVYVITTASSLLQQYCPGAIPVSGWSRWQFWNRGNLANRLLGRAPGGVAMGLFAAEAALRQRFPQLVGRAEDAEPGTVDYASAFSGSDLVLATGAGQLTDPFSRGAVMVLHTLEMAVRHGIPAVMFGQGLGPATDGLLRATMARVLPKLDVLTLREGRAGLPLLRELGVREQGVVVTGDEVIEPVYTQRAATLGPALGVNVRTSSYAGVGGELLPQLRAALHEAARELGAPLAAVPISRHAQESDEAACEELLAGYEPTVEWEKGAVEVRRVVEQAGQCRVVVTGSYHGAVFSLAQGVSVVGLAKSPYYADKFAGLAAQFPGGCRTAFLDGADAMKELRRHIVEAWQEAPQRRGGLLQAAESQMNLARSAYERLYERISGGRAAE
jgi:colanic acid/amylovoran biosynthesis protein